MDFLFSYKLMLFIHDILNQSYVAVSRTSANGLANDVHDSTIYDFIQAMILIALARYCEQ